MGPVVWTKMIKIISVYVSLESNYALLFLMCNFSSKVFLENLLEIQPSWTVFPVKLHTLSKHFERKVAHQE